MSLSTACIELPYGSEEEFALIAWNLVSVVDRQANAPIAAYRVLDVFWLLTAGKCYGIKQATSVIEWKFADRKVDRKITAIADFGAAADISGNPAERQRYPLFVSPTNMPI